MGGSLDGRGNQIKFICVVTPPKSRWLPQSARESAGVKPSSPPESLTPCGDGLSVVCLVTGPGPACDQHLECPPGRRDEGRCIQKDMKLCLPKPES
jgi:hypothetical protein